MFQASLLNQKHLQLLSLVIVLFFVQFWNLISQVRNAVKELNTFGIFMTQDASYVLVLMHRCILERLQLAVKTVPFELDLSQRNTLLIELVWKLINVPF